MKEKKPTVGEDLTNNLSKLSENMYQFDTLFESFMGTTAQYGLHPSVKLHTARQSTMDEFEQVRRNGRKAVTQLQQLQALARTSALITSSLELDHVLGSVMDTIVKLTGAERAYLMLHQEESGPTIRAARNWDQETIVEQDVQFSNSVVQAAIDQGQPIITDNAQTDTRFGGMASIVAQQVRSILCIPLTIHGQLVGVLYADNRFHKGVFQMSMLPLLTAFGTQAAIAIENARRYGNVKEGLEKAEQEIVRLRIAIDEAQRQKDVNRIVDSTSFHELRDKARLIRSRRQKGSTSKTR
jgi:GAF domain-containing protein